MDVADGADPQRGWGKVAPSEVPVPLSRVTCAMGAGRMPHAPWTRRAEVRPRQLSAKSPTRRLSSPMAVVPTLGRREVNGIKKGTAGARGMWEPVGRMEAERVSASTVLAGWMRVAACTVCPMLNDAVPPAPEEIGLVTTPRGPRPTMMGKVGG